MPRGAPALGVGRARGGGWSGLAHVFTVLTAAARTLVLYEDPVASGIALALLLAAWWMLLYHDAALVWRRGHGGPDISQLYTVGMVVKHVLLACLLASGSAYIYHRVHKTASPPNLLADVVMPRLAAHTAPLAALAPSRAEAAQLVATRMPRPGSALRRPRACWTWCIWLRAWSPRCSPAGTRRSRARCH